jgi:hypothetical protein
MHLHRGAQRRKRQGHGPEMADLRKLLQQGLVQSNSRNVEATYKVPLLKAWRHLSSVQHGSANEARLVG